MVLKGQFLERPTLIPLGKEVMEGLWHRGTRRPPVLILPPTPDEGGSMDHVVAAELAWTVAMAGFPVLRFNYRGVGASQGKRGDGGARVDDAEAALRILLENANVANAIVLCIGGSAKTALSLGERHTAISGVGFVSPKELIGADLLRTHVPLLMILGELEANPERNALSAAVQESGGQFVMVDDADQTFRRNLPEVGKAVSRWLLRISGVKPE
ncbi:MAG: alpha/beta hydrolase [Myxococcaceae bacterium]